MQSFAVLILRLDQTIQSLNGLMNNQQNSESAHLIMSHMRRFIDLNCHNTQHSKVKRHMEFPEILICTLFILNVNSV